jgi:hypothetical protein
LTVDTSLHTQYGCPPSSNLHPRDPASLSNVLFNLTSHALLYFSNQRSHSTAFSNDDSTTVISSCLGLWATYVYCRVQIRIRLPSRQELLSTSLVWSGISGFKPTEINESDLVFLETIDWRLHIPKPVFNKWQETIMSMSSRLPSQPCTDQNFNSNEKSNFPGEDFKLDFEEVDGARKRNSVMSTSLCKT